MAFNFILFGKNVEKKYAKITINRPEVMNALNIEVRKEIQGVLEAAREDDDVRALVITGAGEKAFSAGADIRMFEKMGPFDAKEYLKISKGTAAVIEEFPKPIIAAVNGFALGGGLESAMACDIIVASENAKFGQTEVNVGIIPGVGGTQRLPRLVGIKKAKELIFTADLIDSKTALQIGLVNAVVAQNDLMSFVESLVANIVSKSPLILRIAKGALNKSAAGLSEGLDYESALFELCFSTQDAKRKSSVFSLKKESPILLASEICDSLKPHGISQIRRVGLSI